MPTCPHLAATGKCPLKKKKVLLPANYRHPTALGAVSLPVTLPGKEPAAAAVHDTLAYDMAEIKTMLYGIIQEQAEQKITINEQRALITDQKAFIPHMLTEDDYHSRCASTS